MKEHNKFLRLKKWIRIICLLVTVGILCIMPAWEVNASSLEGNAGNGSSTVIEEPGSAETSEDLNQLNIANTVTIEYNNGNGTINGALRILLILTLIAIAPTLLICMTSFTRIIIILHFTKE